MWPGLPNFVLGNIIYWFNGERGWNNSCRLSGPKTKGCLGNASQWRTEIAVGGICFIEVTFGSNENLWQFPLLFHLYFKWKINWCLSSYAGLLCLWAINHILHSLDTPPPSPILLPKENLKVKTVFKNIESGIMQRTGAAEGDKRARSKDRGRHVLTGGYVTGHPRVGHARRFIRLSWGHVSEWLPLRWENYSKRRP